MRRLTIRLAVALSVAVVAGCGKRDSTVPEAGTQAATVEPKVGEAVAAFQPPSDGRLTTGSIERYIAVQRRVSELAKGVRIDDGRPPTDVVAQLATADFRAAKDLGYDPGEYRWVRGTIAEALGRPAESMNIDGVLTNLAVATVESLEERRAEAHDFAERARLDGEITRMKAGLESRGGATAPGSARQASDPAVLEHNRKLLEPFRAQLSIPEVPAPGQLPSAAIASKPSAP